jgi:drug/metabolite transporter, DME family
MDAARRSDRLAIFGSAVLFSTGGVAIQWLTLAGPSVAGFRAAMACVAIALVVPGRASMRHRAVLATGLAQGTTMLLFVLSNKATTAANAIFLQCTAPLYIPLLASRVLGERATKRDLAAMAGVAVGLACFFLGTTEASGTAPNPRLGDLLAIASGVTWACTVVGLRYLARDGAAAPGAAKGALLWGNLLVAAFMLPLGLPSASQATGTDWVILAYMGSVQIALAYRLLVRAVARVPALEASLLAMFEPVLNPVWAFLLLGERPSAWAMVGAAVLTAVTVARAAAGSRQEA